MEVEVDLMKCKFCKKKMESSDKYCKHCGDRNDQYIERVVYDTSKYTPKENEYSYLEDNDDNKRERRYYLEELKKAKFVGSTAIFLGFFSFFIFPILSLVGLGLSIYGLSTIKKCELKGYKDQSIVSINIVGIVICILVSIVSMLRFGMY